ncbi:hypothetical protein M422DRAFT_274891 [Sphaerobolus stellatus SS14]|uniref:Chromo domain-containing protein n=1 Tax=Sphaerobolus stellatus (strain SS14) TaxID=990650 RepID=A0A0C9TR21_SPHS4|nr:hypothetical protein M422DRAFT_274891 [Sphaerobolus stellatus SS14]
MSNLKLRARKIHVTFHNSLIRPHDDEQEWFIVEIIGHEWTNDGLQFRVQWTLGDVTWEPLSGVKELEALNRQQRSAKFSFSKDEILDGLHEAWPHISSYITNLDEEWLTLEKELSQEKANNRQLRDDMDDLQEKIQELEARLLSLQLSTTASEHSMTLTSTTDTYPSDVGPHPLSSPGNRTYACKCSQKLLEDTSFRNLVRVPDEQPTYWSLYMWNVLKDWHTNPMSVPNAIRDNSNSYFLKEDIDVATWISKISSDITRPAFMYQMKVVFGSHINFDIAFSGFDSNLLRADHETTMWLTDSSTPLRIGSQIIKGHTSKSQMPASEKLPKGPESLALVLKHCSLTKEQIYTRIIPYMERHEGKQPCSAAGSERAAYMHLNQRRPAPNKGKRPVTGSLQSGLSVHAPTPVQTGESSQQRLDTDLDSYNQVREPVLPYDEAPPSGTPDVEMEVPAVASTSGTLPNESTMNVDPELDDLYA